MMKKLFFLFALLASIAASASVTVTPLGVNYNEKTVTFRVVYSAAYNNRAWIWIDLCPVSGVTPSTFQTAVISAASATSGSVLYASTNTRGFFVTASPATVTATLSNVTGKFNWCAHGSDYPPNAVINAAGGYTLKGTPPFTINGTMTVNTKTFGAGTCIETITDLTGNPDGITAQPSLSSPNSPSRCSAGAVTLSVTASGGTTTAMTYTWNIGGTTYTNQTNSYTTGSLSSSAAYSVKVKNANNCESNTVNGSITISSTPAAPSNASNNSHCGSGNVTFSATAPSGCTIDWYTTSGGNSTVATGTTSHTRSLTTTTSYYAQSRNTSTGCTSSSRLTVTGTVNQPGANGQSAHATCGCASGTTNCSGTCITTGYTTQNSGVCTGTCNQAWVYRYDQCGTLTNDQYGTYTLSSCSAGCAASENTSCRSNSTLYDKVTLAVARELCAAEATAQGYTYWNAACMRSVLSGCMQYGCYKCN